MKGRYVKKLF